MDIPDTGAVFTLGRSHLSDDHHHYFFIKNDPVERLRCGYNESAAICKSGRCFVWGYNNTGQLGLGQIADIVVKPSCIKEIKQQLLKVVDIAFGDGFSVILTNDNRLFASGKRVLPDSFSCLPSAVEIISKPVAIDDLNEERRYSRIAAGHHQFAAYSKGKKELVICGRSAGEKQCKVKVLRLWDDISELACGSTFTLALSKTGLLYAVGVIGERMLPTLMRVDHPQMNFTSVHVTVNDSIYLTTDTGEVFKNEVELHFHKVTLVPNLNEKIVALTSGKESVLSFVTENQRFFTSMTTPKTIDSPHNYKELIKFKPMDVKLLASGNNHILLHAQRNDQKAFYARNLLNESTVIYPAVTNATSVIGQGRQNGVAMEVRETVSRVNNSSQLNASNKKNNTKSFEVQEYVDNVLNNNQEMNKWVTKTNPWDNCDGDLIRYIPLKGSPKRTLANLEGGVVYKQSPKYPARFQQNTFDSVDSDIIPDKYERVRRELNKDENLKIVRITDPSGREVHHSFQQIPLTASRSTHQLNNNSGDNSVQRQQSKSMMDIRFIDNGVDVTNSIKRVKAAALDESRLLGERLLHPMRYTNNKVGCIKQDTMKEIMELPCVECRSRKSTPFHKQMGVSFEGDDLDDKTTASLNSAPQKMPPTGFMQQIINDFKKIPEEFSCKRDDTIDCGHGKKKYSQNESQICNIL